MAHKKGYDPSIRDELDKADWISLVPKLIKYAKGRLFTLEQTGSKLTYEDIALEAIARLYGRGDNDTYRNWDRKKYPSLYKHLKCIVREIIRREIEKLATFENESLLNVEGEPKLLKPAEDALNLAHVLKARSPADLCIQKEGADRLHKILDKVTENDDDLQNVTICIVSGITKSRDIAVETGLEVSKVYNLKMKLKRRLEKQLTKNNMKAYQVAQSEGKA